MNAYEDKAGEFTTIRLEKGLIGWQAGTLYAVTGTDYDGTAESCSFGESLEAAEEAYWRKKLELGRALIVQYTKDASTAESEVKKAREAWETANAELLEQRTRANADLLDLEAAFMDAAEELTRLGVDVDLGPYVKVVEKNKGISYDEAEAIEWCRENMKAAIIEVLDRKAFESYSRVKELPFVKDLGTAPSARIQRKRISEEIENV